MLTSIRSRSMLAPGVAAGAAPQLSAGVKAHRPSATRRMQDFMAATLPGREAADHSDPPAALGEHGSDPTIACRLSTTTDAGGVQAAAERIMRNQRPITNQRPRHARRAPSADSFLGGAHDELNNRDAPDRTGDCSGTGGAAPPQGRPPPA